jgi:beta-galactosidase
MSHQRIPRDQSTGVFSWTQLEPQSGQYGFGWFDKIITLLHENDIGICLATAKPPPRRFPSFANPTQQLN